MKVPIDSLDNGNKQQEGFWEELDKGIHPLRTNYYRRLKDYRKRTGSNQKIWSEKKLINYMYERVSLYKDVKVFGQKEPIKVEGIRIVDGNHRHSIMKHLGHKEIEI